MLRTSFWIALFGLLALLQGCATNVLYGNEARSDGALQPPYGTSIYMDRDGSLYPPSYVGLSGSLFTTSKSTTATLRTYFQQDSSQGEWRALLADLGLPGSQSVEQGWDKMQSELVARAGKSIAEGSSDGRRSLVFLIHGYNNEFRVSQRWYRLVEADIASRIRKARGHEPFFVRVHWDGLSEAIPVRIWTKAQWNGPLAGLTLRKILKSIDGQLIGDPPLVMLSHSTGALVAANTVGDGSAALDCPGSFEEHCPAVRDSATLPKLVSKVRVGLLIPAASLDTFDNFKTSPLSPQAIVLGLNHRDFPTNKVLGCRWLGSTCLNVWTVNACRQVRAVFPSGGRTQVALFEFSNSQRNQGRTGIFWETHAVEDQMQRDRWSPFIERLLFSDSATQDDGAAYCG